MKKWIARASGMAAGLGIMAAVACNAAASAPTATPTGSSPIPISQGPTAVPTPPPSQTPISIIDDMDPKECNFIHNIDACFVDGQLPAGIPLDEYMALYFQAREDLKARFGVEPKYVRTARVERVEWPDASLGNPQPGMGYAQVITPGFRLVLEAEGKSYVYHTSMRHVVLVDGQAPDGGKDAATTDEQAEIVRRAVEWALVDGQVPDLGLLPDPQNIIVAVDGFDPALVPQVPGVTLILTTPEEVQQKANKEGDFLYLHLGELEVGKNSARIVVATRWAVQEGSQRGYLSGGGCALEYVKESGKWVQSDQMMCWIA